MKAHFGRGVDRMLGTSPRTLEFLAAVVIVLLAMMFLGEIVFYEWFRIRYRQFYQQPTPAERTIELICNGLVLLFVVWLVCLARSLARGESRRVDRGLFAPRSLRVWGVVFAIAPFVLIAVAWRAVLEIHLLGGFWVAAVACFVLAKRRSESTPPPAAAPTPAPPESWRPPPID